jgi:hypothetical protein
MGYRNFETDVADKEFRAKLRAFLSSQLQELFGGDVSKSGSRSWEWSKWEYSTTSLS